jgi:sugar phosphate permease
MDPDRGTAVREADAFAMTAAERRVFARIAWRLVPILLVGYVLNYLDRSNIGFAALTMNKDLGLTASQFGVGAGVLFVSYCVFEIPSNMAMYRFGARLWLARIMITWGIVSAATAFVVGEKSFYLLRFLLGLAEAGFFPGVTFYLAAWFPAELRTRMLAWFLLGIPLSSVVGGIVSGFVLQMDQIWGLAGWKWLFLVEGLPTIIIGLLAMWLLADRPDKASWLSGEERRLVEARLASERRDREVRHLLPAVRDSRVLTLAIIQFGFTLASYGVGIWLPLIIKQQNFGNVTVGFLTALPYVFASIGMLLWAASVDRGASKIRQLALTCSIAAVGLVVAVLVPQFAVSLAAVTVALVGITAARAIFWTIPTRFLTGIAAAGGLAFINSIGTLGGFFGPATVGWLKDATGNFDAGFYAMAVILAVAAALALSLRLLVRSE